MTDVLLYPGCAIPSKLPFVEAAARYVLEFLSIGHRDLPDFTCCVEPVGLRSIGFETWAVAGARIHAIADKECADILTLCDGCTLSLKEAGEILESCGSESANEILKEIRLRYQGPVGVTGFLETVHSRLDDIKTNKVRSTDLRLGIHPGCHGDHLYEGDGAQRMMAEIVEALGGEAVTAKGRVCCGGSLTSVNDEVAKEVSQEALDTYEGSDALLTSCPFCFLQFDTVVRSKRVVHLAELVAHCLGWDLDYMSYHRTQA